MLLSSTVNTTELGQAEARWLHAALIALTCFVIILSRQGWPWQRDRRMAALSGLDLSFLSAMTAATCYSCISLYRGAGGVYLEVICVLASIHALGTRINRSSQAGVLAALRAISDKPARYRRRTDATDAYEWVGEADLMAGDEISVPAGDIIPVDSTILEGQAFIDTSSMTGESFWAPCGVADQVRAGSRNVDGHLHLRVDGGPPTRTADAMCAEVLTGVGDKARVQGMAERLGPWFAGCVSITASLVGTYWWRVAGPERAFLNAMAVLLVACPCALGFATPVALWTAATRLARLGVATRNTAAIERLAAANTMIFDKTGTLTSITGASTDVRMLTQGSINKSDLVSMLTAAEAASHHPIARAFAAMPRAQSASKYRLLSFHPLPGRGIEAELAGPLLACTLRVTDWRRGENTSATATAAVATLSKGTRPFELRLNGELVAIAGVEERTVTNMRRLFERLASLGVSSAVCSGDRTDRLDMPASVVAKARQTPASKVLHVESEQARGRRVCFVGDGVNDARAMAKSHASIAIVGGSRLALATADFSFEQKKLEQLPEIVGVAQLTMQSLRRSLGFAVVYNIVGMTFAACGLLHPVGAACLMLAASLTVTLRSLRLQEPTPMQAL